MAQAGRPREFQETEVLDRGIEYFRTHGFEGGGLTGLLEYTGLSRQSLYNIFGDKKGFFDKCLVRYRLVWGERFFGKLHDPNADMGTLKGVMLGVVRFLVRDPEGNCLIVKTTMESNLSPDVVMEQIRFHSKYKESGIRAILLRECEKRGISKTEDEIDRIISLIICTIMGLHVMAKGHMGEKRMKEAVLRSLDFIF